MMKQLYADARTYYIKRLWMQLKKGIQHLMKLKGSLDAAWVPVREEHA